MKAPVKYFGGKGNMLNTLIDLFPQDCTVYVEPYGGAGSVLLGKPRHPVEIYNDLEKNVYTLFKVLSNPVLFVEFHRLAELALYCQTLSDEYRISLRSSDLEPVQRAFQFWYVNRTRYNGSGNFYINTSIRRNISYSTSTFLSSVEGLAALHTRLATVIVTNLDALEMIDKYDVPDSFLYLDPPYVQSTRGSTRYAQDADDAHHKALVWQLLSVRDAKVLLSGYDNVIYEPLIKAGWHRQAFTINTQDTNRQPKTKTEVVWMNYQNQRRLL